MSTVYLKTYLEEIRSAYEEARGEYVELSDKLEEENRNYDKIQHSHDYSASGKRKASERHEEAVGELMAQLQAIRSDMDETCKEITGRADAVFGDLYRVTPEKLDMAALELLKSDILTNDELVSLAANYGDNKTMVRYFAKYAKERLEQSPENTELRRLFAAGQDNSIPHMEALNTMTMWTTKALRPERYLADAIAKEFDQHADQIIAEYGDLSRDV